MAFHRLFPPTVNSWRDALSLMVAALVGVIVLIVLSPALLLVGVFSLFERARETVPPRAPRKSLHEAIPR